MVAREHGLSDDKLPPYVMPDKQRDGRPRWLFRRRGYKKVTLKGVPGSKAFWESYAAAMAGQPQPGAAQPIKAKRVPTNIRTLGWLCDQWCASGLFLQNTALTQSGKKYTLNEVRREPVKQGQPKLMEEFPLDELTFVHIEKLRDRKVDTPTAANNRLNCLSQMFKWAVKHKYMKANPAAEVEHLRVAKGGHHTWTEEEVLRYQATHPPGTKAHLALSLALFTGFRISDLSPLGRQHVSKHPDPQWGFHWIEKREHKNSSRQEKILRVPLLPVLKEALDAAAPVIGELTFLVSERGAPYSTARLGVRIREWCREAGLPHCSAHGLRKAGSAIASENGASTETLKAIYGWRNSAEVDIYTRKAQQKKLAAQGMHLLKLTPSPGQNQPGD